ncbi:MAG: hypothetical protein WB507_01545 [Solirubrobacterales bacterium]
MNDDEALTFAKRVLKLAWADLPPPHRSLLESIGAKRWDVTSRPLGTYADELLRSAGYPGLARRDRVGRDRARGLWIPDLRVVLINAVHPDYDGLNPPSRENAIARVAWHEWGHALGIHRASREDVAAGSKLLDSLPKELAKTIRSADYLRREYAHEVVAEVYSLLMVRRRKGVIGRPNWVSDEVYELIRRVVGWIQ